MTKFLLNILLIPACLLIFPAYAQIVVNQADMPSVGDTIRVSRSVLPAGVDFQQAGANVAWDISNLQALNQTLISFKALSTVPFIYQIIFTPVVANLAVPIPSVDFFPGFQLTDIYEFYRKTTTLYGRAGFGLTLATIPIPMKFDNPEIFFRFPVTYLSTDSSTSTFSVGLPGYGFYDTYRKRVNRVDAWGTLKTPHGTYACIRIKSNLTTRDSIFVDSLSIGQAVNRQITEYRWLAKGIKQPIMQIAVEGPLVTATYVDSIRVFVGVPEIEGLAESFRIYPNPATERINISFNQKIPGQVLVELFDLSGRKVATLMNQYLPSGRHSRQCPLPSACITRGVYIVRVITSEYTHAKKITIQ